MQMILKVFVNFRLKNAQANEFENAQNDLDLNITVCPSNSAHS